MARKRKYVRKSKKSRARKYAKRRNSCGRKHRRNPETYELFYGNGGHGGPYRSLASATEAAGRLLRGSRSESYIQIRARSNWNKTIKTVSKKELNGRMRNPAGKKSGVVNVIFRKWNNGEIIALFPKIKATNSGPYCVSYEHVGQHGSADCRGVVARTKAATPREYADLAAELRRIGYQLKVVSRC